MRYSTLFSGLVTAGWLSGWPAVGAPKANAGASVQVEFGFLGVGDGREIHRTGKERSPEISQPAALQGDSHQETPGHGTETEEADEDIKRRKAGNLGCG